MTYLAVNFIIFSNFKYLHKVFATNPVHFAQIYSFTTVRKGPLCHKLIQADEPVAIGEGQNELIVLGFIEGSVCITFDKLHPCLFVFGLLFVPVMHAHIILDHASGQVVHVI